MKFIRTDFFKDDFKGLPRDLQRRTEKALYLLGEDIRHPSLRVKKMKGKEDIWEARVSKGYRFTFQIRQDAYLLRHVGTHGKTLGKP